MRMAYILPTVFGIGLSIAGGRMLYLTLTADSLDNLRLAKAIGLTAVGVAFIALLLWRTVRRRNRG